MLWLRESMCVMCVRVGGGGAFLSVIHLFQKHFVLGNTPFLHGG